MPNLSIEGVELDLPRNLALLDTNVLVAVGDDRDNNHEQALLVFDLFTDYEFGVTPPVVLETLGMLTSRRGRDVALRMSRWLRTPGNVIILPSLHNPSRTGDLLDEHSEWMRKYSIDYVDSHLMHAADLLTHAWTLMPHAPIITFDTGDFFRCAKSGYRYSLYDMRELDLLTFS